MSTPPLITPGPGQRTREISKRRRHRRRRLGAAGALLSLVLLAVALDVLLAGSSSEPAHGSTRRAHHARTPRAAVALSPAGLALSKPAFPLSGLASPLPDPVHVVLHHPPRAALLFNLDTGQVLWQLRPLQRVRVASLTKMMTALITVQSEPPAVPVLVTPQAVAMDGSKVGVLPLGRHVPLESLLYGLMLPSGNDAAVALAQKVAGTVPAFVARMNSEAASLGLGCTRYSSPSGFYDAGNFSCAADLAVLAHVDLAEPRIARVARTYSAAPRFPIRGGRLYLYNNNPLLIYHYPGATGLKTGWTEAAGRCLVGTAERDGVRLGAVVLDSVEPGRQARALLNAGFIGYYHQRPVREAEFPPGA